MIDWLVFGGCLAMLLAVCVVEGLMADRAATNARDRALAEERREAEADGRASEELGPVELAMLAGGQWGAMDVLLAGLVADGVLERVAPDAEAPERWAASSVVTAATAEPDSAATAEPDGLESEVREAAAGPGLYLWELTARCLRHDLTAIEESLVARGYLRPARWAGHVHGRQPADPPYPVPEVRGRRWGLGGAGGIAVLCAAFLAIDGAWARATLAVFAAAVIVTMSWREPAQLAYRTRPLPTVTWRGALCLERARTRYAGLDPRSRPKSLPYDPTEARMAVALFTREALQHLHPHLLADRDAPTVYVEGPGE